MSLDFRYQGGTRELNFQNPFRWCNEKQCEQHSNSNYPKKYKLKRDLNSGDFFSISFFTESLTVKGQCDAQRIFKI